MRAFLFLFPAILMAQTPPAKSPASGGQSCDSAAKAATPATAAKSAKAKAATPAAAPGALTTDDQKTIYAVGLSMAQQLSQLELSRAELEIVKQALTDAAAGKPAVELSDVGTEDQHLRAGPDRLKRRRRKKPRPRPFSIRPRPSRARPARPADWCIASWPPARALRPKRRTK